MTTEAEAADAPTRPTMECPHCRELILEGARICRFCGRKLGRGSAGGAVAIAVVLFALIAAPVGWIMLLGPNLNVIDVLEARADVRAKLADPGSAQFRKVRIYKQWSAQFQTELDSVCGEVNAKNHLGGYTGFQRFIHGGGVAIMEPVADIGTEDGQWFENLWANNCVNKPRGSG